MPTGEPEHDLTLPQIGVQNTASAQPHQKSSEELTQEQLKYTEEEKAKLANIISAFQTKDNKEERAKA